MKKAGKVKDVETFASLVCVTNTDASVCVCLCFQIYLRIRERERGIVLPCFGIYFQYECSSTMSCGSCL